MLLLLGPPVRESSVCSPTERVSSAKEPGSSAKPQPEITCAACAGSAPISAAGAFMAKYTPGSITAAESSAMIATKLSISIAP